MSNASVWLGPTIVALIFGGAITVGWLLLLRAWVRKLHADHAAALAKAQRASVPVILFHRQAEAIDAVIDELASHPATYETFPADIRELLYAAHDKARELERS